MGLIYLFMHHEMKRKKKQIRLKIEEGGVINSRMFYKLETELCVNEDSLHTESLETVSSEETESFICPIYQHLSKESVYDSDPHTDVYTNILFPV